MKIVDQKDFVAGLFYCLFGIATMLGATRYSFGTASAMGPGYFPFIAGAALTIIGLVVIASAIGRDAASPPLEHWDMRKIGIVLGALLVFAATLDPLGLVIALPLLVGISAFAHPEFTWRGTLGTIIVLLPLVWVIFVYALGVRLPVLPEFMR